MSLQLEITGGHPVELVETSDDQELRIVEVGFQVIGLPAPGGGSPLNLPDIEEVNATEDIPARSFITATGKVGNSNNIAHFNRLIGFVVASTLTGFIANAIVEGEVVYNGWSWAPGQELFLNGTSVSATPPSSGFTQLVGVARSANTALFRLQVPIQI